MKKIVVINQKMFFDYKMIVKYINVLKDYKREDIDIVIAPSDVFIPYYLNAVDVQIAAQNISSIFATGEISAKQCKSLGVTYSILGHGERKVFLKESCELVNLNIKSAMEFDIVPIVCVGELNIHDDFEVVFKQIKDCFNNVTLNEKVIVAYEPCFAIGKKGNLDAKAIYDKVTKIKNYIMDNYRVNLRIIYGGGITLSNIDSFGNYCFDGFMISKSVVDTIDTITFLNKVG